jgi:predicted O-methyltransferase YrrM
MSDLEEFAQKFATILTTHIQSLDAIVKSTGETLEGNCMYFHESDFQTSPIFLNKQLNLVSLAKQSSRILEIGFNAGHSALLFLMTAPPGTIFRFFDIAEHSYVKPCYEYLKAAFPERDMELIVGDSKITLPAWFQEHPEPFDLIHVDGGHDYECVKADVHSAFLLTKKGSILLMDDMDNEYVQGFVETMLRDKIATPVEGMLETTMYPHIALIVLQDVHSEHH